MITSRESDKIRYYAKRVRTKIWKDEFFTGYDPMIILDFLQKIVLEFNLQGMNESQAYRVIPGFSKSVAGR